MRKTLYLFIFAMSFTVSSIAQLSWSAQEYDFGTSQLNVPVAHEFKFANYSTKQVTISYMKSTCYCLVPNWTKEVIEPSEEGTILITYTPNKEGRYTETLEIYLDKNPFPQKIFVKGIVGNENFNLMNRPALAGKPAKDNLEMLQKPNLTPPPSVTEVPPSKPTTKQEPQLTQNETTLDEMPIPGRPAKPKRKPKKEATIPNRNHNEGSQPVAVKETGKFQTAILPEYVGSAVLNTAANEAYLSEREKAMVKEINLIRSNPKAYIKVVEAYVTYMKADKGSIDFYRDDINTSESLIKELKNTPPLSVLQPSKGIHNAAVAHGKEAQSLGTLDHQGKDGSWPWDRVVAYDKNMEHGGENIVGGLQDIRKAVLTLLIDSGIQDRGHRKTLLNPEWTHIACYEVGMVGEMPYMWLQNFGKSKVNETVPAPTKPRRKPQTNDGGAVAAYDMNTEPSIPVPSIDAEVGYDEDGRLIPGSMTSGTSPNIPGENSSVSEDPSKVSRINNGNLPTDNSVEDIGLGTNNLAYGILPPEKAYTASKATYMSKREQDMIAEINFLRMNPRGYIKVIKSYMDFMETEVAKDKDAAIFYNKELKSASELIELLERLQPLNRLKPHRGVFNAALIHGEYAKSSGNLEKQGSDGSMPRNRIMKYAEDIIDGDENLPSGTPNIRYSIVRLLIDKDDNNRTQRKILLDPKWSYVGIYEVGVVGNMHYWVQDFGQARSKGKPMHDIEGETNGEENPIMGYSETQTLTATTVSTEIQPTENTLDVSNVNYLSTREEMLLREINFLRANPDVYADIVGTYIEILKDEKIYHPKLGVNYVQKIEAATFIQNKLRNTKAVGLLMPNANIYQAAFQHGQDCKRNRSLTHWGSDNSNTWQRLQKALPAIEDGDQCIVGDSDDIRISVINILIDHAVLNRNRQVIALNPNWTVFGAAEVGDVGVRKNCWVITFGML